jgi:hypothetical protein
MMRKKLNFDNQQKKFQNFDVPLRTTLLGAKSTSIRDCVGPSVGRSVPHDARLHGKLVTLRLLREEEEEEETDYVAIPLRRDSITSRFLRT